MPAITHLNRLAPRFLESSESTGITGGAIALIVCVGIVPVIILIWVVSWLLFTYPGGRTCWCTRRKRKTSEPALPVLETSRESLNEKSGYMLPQRPMASYRTDTESSNGSRPGSRTLKKHQPRASVNSMWSNANNDNAPVVQEPKPFV